jgi:inner membrane protease subunit 2
MVFSRLAPLLGRNGKHAIFIRDTSYFLFAFATWIPAAAFFKYHVGEIASVHGPSMYPYLNTDFDRSLKQDVCWINKWKAIENVQRGMIVTFW